MSSGEGTTPTGTLEVRGARGLLFLRIAQLGFYLVGMLFFQVAVGTRALFGSESFELALRVQEVIWYALDVAGVALLVPFVAGRRETRAKSVSRAALALATVSLAIGTLQLVDSFGGPKLFAFGGDPDAARLFNAGNYGVFVAFEVCFWLAITRSAAHVPRALSPVFYLMLALSSAFALSRMLLPFDAYGELFVTGTWAPAFPWLRMALVSARMLCPILVLYSLTRGGAEAQAGAPADAQEPSGTRDLIVGSLWLGGGALVTAASYSAASGGGRYVVTTGAIVYGLWRIVRGLMRTRARAAGD